MLQHTDDITASCVCYVLVHKFDQLEQRKITVSTVTKLGIVILIVQYDMVISVSFR